MTKTPRAVVVGGGLAGLVAARHLAAAGLEVTLLERRDAVGGRVQTRERDGYRFDRGFQVLFTAYPAVRRELDLESLELCRFDPGATVARPGRRSVLADPLRRPRATPETVTSSEVSTIDKLRLAALWWRLGRTDPEAIFAGEDESIERYLRERGFSERFLENFARPFYGGITLDRSLSTSSRVFEYTFRALATGDIAVPAAGMGAIPRQLAGRVEDAGATIETGVAVESVSSDGGDDGNSSAVSVVAEDRTIDADAVVVATDPPTARALTGVSDVPTDARSCLTQYYGLPGESALGGEKRLLLNAADDEPNHVVPHSAVAPSHAPEGRTLLSATYLGTPAETDEELTETTRQTLESWFPGRPFDGLERLRTDRIEFAQFAQPPGVHDGLPNVRDPAGSVYLAGEYTHWSSIQGAMESGRDAAAAVVRDLSK
ncbi:NAD(P)/FAD-dependent oxidoreductase [Natrarchaeobius chitinivorans]|uniref:NAD(P)/FAD-dependent oxidoreductase n=1 Tax=Natrarchaeobius chitinivorans TaxID=1679083 RepID=A0A3N6LTI0_NATCH|nr:NAD(P)/FAD-dependent oxidoreductase [Natrarchaeobius chitinivorans]RQG93363.1 NAD(P)/FAD-dependent oxidoreductase [Natrarchaeobius chitinivorans]